MGKQRVMWKKRALWKPRLFILVALGLLALSPHATAYDVNGATEITIPNSVLQLVGDILPESSNAGAAYVSESYSPNIVVDANCNISVIFVHEGAGYQNTLGYFTYTEAQNGDITIVDANLIWQNASMPWAVDKGDIVTLKDADGEDRVFTSGERVGFFVVANGNNSSSEVANFDPDDPAIPTNSPTTNAGVGLGLYTTIDKLNPEFTSDSPDLARHCAMLFLEGVPGFLDGEDFYLTAFEDLNRTGNSDDDFNDLVFIVTSNPITAIDTTDVFVYVDDDPDNDGVEGTDDHYPHDGDRATVTRYPSSGYNVLALEDNYPNVGDADYNDAVIAYYFETISDADGDIKDVLGTFHLLARGAALDHRFGVHIPGIPANATGTLKLERFLSNGAATHETPADVSVANLVSTMQRRVSHVFPSTTLALAPPQGGNGLTNTNASTPDRNAASARFWIQFTNPIDKETLGTVPFDLYFAIDQGNGGEADVHLPGLPGFSDRPQHLPTESGALSFMDDAGYPFMIEVPTSWRFPLERKHVQTAYTQFASWRSSSGNQNKTWFQSPTSTPNTVASQLTDYIPARTWTVKRPDPREE